MTSLVAPPRPIKQSSFSKKKGLPPLDAKAWGKLLQPQSGTIFKEQVLNTEARADDFCFQMGQALRPGGPLAAAASSLRFALLETISTHCIELFSLVEDSRLRMTYEHLRDHIVSPADPPAVAIRLQEATLTMLTDMLIRLNAAERDIRLLKAHVGVLYRMLDPRGLERVCTISTRVTKPQALAADCLKALEIAYPTLLSYDAAILLQLATDSATYSSGNPACLLLSATVIGNSCSLYLQQQTAAQKSLDSEDSEGASGVVSPFETIRPRFSNPSNIDSEALLLAAAEVLGKSPELHQDLGLGVLGRSPPTDIPGARQTLGPTSVLEPFSSMPTDDNTSGDVPSSPTKAGDLGEVVGESPCDVVSAGQFAASPTQTSRRSLLSNVCEDEPTTCSVAETSALTLALAEASASVRSPAEMEVDTPRTTGSSAVFMSSHMPLMRPATGPLRRLQAPCHLSTGDISDAPRIVLTSDCQTDLQAAVAFFLSSLRRLPPAAVNEIARVVVPLLKVAPCSPTTMWPQFERLLMTRSTPLMKAVLSFYDQLPEMFAGRGPALMEKALQQMNDTQLAVDHRGAAAAWVLRCHARSMHSGGTLLLADSWDMLLLRPTDPAPVASIKVKCLAACVSAGVADAETVCRSVCGWEGFGGGGYSSKQAPSTDQQLRSATYALRMLRAVQCPDEGATHRAMAALAASTLHMLTLRPELAPAVVSFINQSDEGFVELLLRALDALFGSVDGQFEVLRERKQEAEFASGVVELSSKVKAAVLTRSSSLSGMMRGLSFQLSFSKRSHSVAGSEASTSQVGTPRRVNVKSLRHSIASVFQDPFDVASPTTSYATARSLGSVNTRTQGAASRHTTNNNNNTRNNSRTPSVLPAVEEREERMIEFPLEDEDVLESYTIPDVPSPPTDVTCWATATQWLTAKSTWEACGQHLLRHDLMCYRGLMQMVLQLPSAVACPIGTLQVLANYSWQYKDSHPIHALPEKKQTGSAILALCHATVLQHLLMSPERGGPQLGEEQKKVAAAVRGVLDALEEGFPVPEISMRAKSLGRVVEDSKWQGDGKCAVLERILNSYIDVAVQG